MPNNNPLTIIIFIALLNLILLNNIITPASVEYLVIQLF